MNKHSFTVPVKKESIQSVIKVIRRQQVPTLNPPGVAPLHPPGVPTLHPPGVPNLHPPGVRTLHPPGVPNLHPPGVPTLHPPAVPNLHPPGVPTLHPPGVPNLHPPDMTSKQTPDVSPLHPPDVAPQLHPDVATQLHPDVAPQLHPDVAPQLHSDVAPQLHPDVATQQSPSLSQELKVSEVGQVRPIAGKTSSQKEKNVENNNFYYPSNKVIKTDTNKTPKTRPGSKNPQKPEKPESAFLTFIKKHGSIFEGEGDENGYKKASEMWQKSSPAYKSKFERDHLKAKTKYLADLVKYDEKVRKQQMVEEKKKKAKGSTPVYLLPANKYINKNNESNIKQSEVMKPKVEEDKSSGASVKTDLIRTGKIASKPAIDDVQVNVKNQIDELKSGLHPSLSTRTHNRLTVADLKLDGFMVDTLEPGGMEEVGKKTGKAYKELQQRFDKEEQLGMVVQMKMKGAQWEKTKPEETDKAQLFKAKPDISAEINAVDDLAVPCTDVRGEKHTAIVDGNQHDIVSDPPDTPQVELNGDVEMPIDIIAKDKDVSDDNPEDDCSAEASKRIFWCQCGISFSSLFWYKTHVKSCLPIYQCDQCPKKFKSNKCLRRHNKAAHVEGKLCNLCGDTFSTEKQLERHIMSKHEPEVVCQTCGNVYKNKESLRKHRKRVCDKKKVLKCEDREKKSLVEYSTNSDDSDMEMDKVQLAKKPKTVYRCSKCPKTYTSTRGLRGHKAKFHSTAQTNQPAEPVLVIDGDFVNIEEITFQVEDTEDVNINIEDIDVNIVQGTM